MTISEELLQAVEAVIRRGSNYMTAFQILERLPRALRDQLLSEYGSPGQGGGRHYTAVTAVTQAAGMLCKADICEMTYIDAGNLYFELAGDLKKSGGNECACYRIRRETREEGRGKRLKTKGKVKGWNSSAHLGFFCALRPLTLHPSLFPLP